MATAILRLPDSPHQTYGKRQTPTLKADPESHRNRDQVTPVVPPTEAVNLLNFGASAGISL